jgi:hypothetical protein
MNQLIVSRIVDQMIQPPGEYKVEYRTYDERNRTYFQLKVFYYVIDRSNLPVFLRNDTKARKVEKPTTLNDSVAEESKND